MSPHIRNNSNVGSLNVFPAHDYKFLRQLGSGGYGTVHLAQDPNGNLVAIKRIPKANYSDGKIDQIKTEILNWSVVRHHPNIVNLYGADFCSNNEDVTVVMEYVQGLDLLEFVKQQGKLSEERTRIIFQKIVDALDHCHRNRIAHRDIKPDNILIGDNDDVRLIDFGDSEEIDDFSNPDEVGYPLKGSLMTSSPQIIQMRQYYLMKNYNGEQIRVYPADLWALGVVLYVMLAGKWPFGHQQIHERMIYREIRRGKYDIPQHLSEGAKDLLNRLLTISADKRMTMQELKQHTWFRQGYQPVVAPRATNNEIATMTRSLSCAF
eukprot:TRINITY_DN749_c0_g1_i4.p1 TRINITY_DN749_c0_g1~~TRINITY_DN749_c0_g1_i4.p1  ORF type:complete len:321 (-),score=14.68 TRINITY_DN749_c0_g1_i4:4445-5407(-)